MYANVNSGQSQLFVSLRIVANVAAHCAHSAKKTMMDEATGTLKIGRLVPGHLAD
jgi:hypothetical protein